MAPPPSPSASMIRLIGRTLALCFLLTGCSPKEHLPSTVSGAVTLDGQPVTIGTILLITEKGQAASAVLQADGTYSLRCYPGTYQVAVSPPPGPDPFGPPDTPDIPRDTPEIPRQYQDVGTSGLTTEVKQGPNRFNLQLESTTGLKKTKLK